MIILNLSTLSLQVFQALEEDRALFPLCHKWLHLCFSWIQKKGWWCFFHSESIIHCVKFFPHLLCLEKWELCYFCMLVFSSFLSVSTLFCFWRSDIGYCATISLGNLLPFCSFFKANLISYGLNPKKGGYYKTKPMRYFLN